MHPFCSAHAFMTARRLMDTRVMVEVLNRPRGVVCAELTATGPGRTAWIGIYRVDLKDSSARALLRRLDISILPSVQHPIYHIKLFEIADELRETDFYDGDMQNRRSFIAVGVEDLLSKLAELGVSVDRLDYPWRIIIRFEGTSTRC
jgi:hypothetical protein